MQIDELQRWASEESHFCGRTNRKRGNPFVYPYTLKWGLSVKIFVIIVSCTYISPIQSLAVKSSTNSPVGDGFIRGFLSGNSNSSGSSTFSSSRLENKSNESGVPKPKPTLPTRSSSHFVKTGRRRNVDASDILSSFSAEDKKKILQFIPESLFAKRFSEEGRKEIKERARFLVGSLNRQNCFSKVICGLGARPPSTKTDLLNDYVYLMNDLLVDDDNDKSGEEGKSTGPTAESVLKFRDDSDISSKQEVAGSKKPKDKKKKFPYLKNDSEEDLEALVEDDYNPLLAQMADEELVPDDPAILKFMELEMKKRLKHRPPPGPPPPSFLRHRPRYRRNVAKVDRGNMTNSEMKSTPNPTKEGEVESRRFKNSKSRKRAQKEFQDQGRFLMEPPMNALEAKQFISKRRIELRNERDFKKRLSLAADAGRTLRNRRQCRLLFDDCPLDERQIDSIVVGLKRVMDAGNLAAIMPPKTTLAPEQQAVVDAVKKTVASTQATNTASAAPGSKVEIILHLNQNGMPYATQTQPGSYAATAYIQPQPQPVQFPNGTVGTVVVPSQIPPPQPLPYIPPSMGIPSVMPAYPEMFTTTTTPRPVAEEQLLDFLYGVVNFNSTSEAPLLDFDWSGTGSAAIKPLKDKPLKPKPVSTMDLSEYLETPLKVKNQEMIYARDPIFDNSAEKDNTKDATLLQSALDSTTDTEELNALKDYLASLKETLVGIYQMNNASLVAESNIFGKSSEESKESVNNDLSKESNDDDYFEISTGNKGGSKDSEEEDDDILGEDKEVLLKLKGAKDKRRQKQKKKGGKRTTTTERNDFPVDDELDKEEDSDKIFDDDDSDNADEKKPEKKPATPPRRKRPGKRPQQKRPGQNQTGGKTTKKKKKPTDDEEEVKEVPTDESVNSDGDEEEEEGDEEYEDEEDEEEYEDGEGEESNGEGDYEESGEGEGNEEEDEEEEDEEEGRSKDKESVLSSAASSLLKPDPTKITLIFAPSGTGADKQKASDLKGDDEMTSEEKKKLAALTEVLLPTAPAPPPLSPKKPIEDPDDKPVVPAAPPVHREFQKVSNFVSNTKIVNISDFDESNPTHPKFHKKYKKRPSYRNPAAKKKKAQALAQAQAAAQKRPFGRPVGSPLYFRPPPPRGPPRGRPKPGADSSSKEQDQQQDDVGTSGEAGSSEEGDDLEEEREEEGEEEEEREVGEDEPEDEEKSGEDEKTSPDENEENPEEDNDSDVNDDEKHRAEIEFGPDHVPPPGPGPPGIGKLQPESRDGMDDNGKQGLDENVKQAVTTKTLIAVPYFRKGTETKYVQGPPPVGGGANGENTFGKFFVNMMGMKQVTTNKPQGDSPDYPPYFGIPPHQRNKQKPHSVSYEDKDTSPEIKSFEDDTGSMNDTDAKPTKLDGGAVDENVSEDIPPKQFKATITVDTTKGDTGGLYDDEEIPEFDIDEPQDDKGKGKKKGKEKEKDKKEKKKKKKKKKRKRKKKKKGGPHMHWNGGNPSLFIESGGGDGLFNQLKKYVADTVGTVLYLPPEDQANKPPVVLSDLPPAPPVTQIVPIPVPHFSIPIPWDDDDSDECGKGKGKKKGKKKKNKGREGRKKKKKKKKKGSKEESCEASSEEDWDDDDDDDKKGDKKDGDKKDGDKKDGDKKKDGEKRDDLYALSNIIERVDSGKLIINPSVSPTEYYVRTSTTTEGSIFGRKSGKSTLAPRPQRYKITKRPRTPKPATPRPILINTSFDGISANQTLYYRPPPTQTIKRKPSFQDAGNIGEPIELFTTSTQRTTTPRLELTTLKHLVPKPTRRKLQYKTPNKRQGGSSGRPRRPMIGTVYTHQIKELTTTQNPKSKDDDDEHEPASVHFQPMPGGHYIKNQAPPSIEKFHTLSADMLEKEEDDYYKDEESDSRELRGRRPLLDIDKLLPFRRKQDRLRPTPQAHLSSYQIITNRLKDSLGLGGSKPPRAHEVHSDPSRTEYGNDEETIENEERREEENHNKRESHSKGRKRKQRPKGTHHHQHHHVHPHPHHHAHPHHKAHPPPVPPTAPGTTGLQAIKNFNIRNLLSKYGNSLLDKTIAYGRRK